MIDYQFRKIEDMEKNQLDTEHIDPNDKILHTANNKCIEKNSFNEVEEIESSNNIN